jgi:hypothetical protein
MPPKKRLFRTLFALLVFVVLAFGPMAGCLIASANYPSMYDYPAAVDGVRDYSSYKIGNWFHCEDKWEFFYKRWIVSDQDNGANDGVYFAGDPWSGRIVNGEPCDYDAYASYRLTMINLPSGGSLYPMEMTQDGAYRMFVNGRLVLEVGVPNKEISQNQKSLYSTFVSSFSVPEDGKLVLVVELGNNHNGGLFTPPGLVNNRTNPGAYNYFLAILPTISFALVTALLFASLLLCYLFGIKTIDYSLLGYLVLLYLTYLGSVDTLASLRTFGKPLNVYGLFVTEIVCQALLSISLSFYMIRKNFMPFLKTKKTKGVYLGLYSAFNVILVVETLRLYGYQSQAIPWFFLISLPLAYGLYLAILWGKGTRYGMAMSLTTVGYFAFSSVAILDIDKILCFGSESFPSMAMLCASFFIFLMLLDKTLRLAKEQKEKNQRVLDYDRVKQESLREQIKPHFIFNCLTAIENNYHKDTAMGDEAMNLFAHHLRSDVDSMGVDLIPFEDEITNTMNYVSLENLRIEKPFHLLLNITCQDFLVPPFSLQPLVENSIKYSQVNEKEDGFIIISSSLDSAGNVVVEVSDNGVGYDVTQVASHSVGIKNLSERFQILLNAKLSVVSMPGKGTKTTITFPKKLGQ